MNNSRMKEAEIVDILRNSPKGQLRYENGWDEKPQSILQLVSAVQAEAEEPKIAILERAMRITKISEQRSRLLREEKRGSAGTSSGSGSRLTFTSEDFDDGVGTSNNDDTDNCGRKSHGPDGVKKSVSNKPKRRGYGIREEEYDDELMAQEVELELLDEVPDHIDLMLKEYEENIRRNVDKKSKTRREMFDADLKNCNAKGDIVEQTLRRENSLKFKGFSDFSKEEAKIMAEIEISRSHRKQQDEKLDLIYESKQKQIKEAKKIASESAALEKARLAKIKEAEEQEAQIKLKNAEIQEDRRRKHEEETKKKAEAHEANVRLEAQKLVEQSSNEQTLPLALQGLILKEDCDKYTRCTDLIQKYEIATKDIVAGSTDPKIKKFYFNAGICINTPLNAVANTDPQQIAIKTTHFINMIEGKSVYGRSSSEPFCAATMPNGRLLVVRLLAYRIVKKAEQEILSEKKGFLPLATIGTSLCRKFPELATLIQAYFYKLCPFLVPFSFPRGDKSFQDYCQSLGYDLKGEDSTLRNILLGRIKGYCSLYATMVQTIENQGPYNVGEANLFFSIGGVWEILTKTMKLEPQPDVTIMVIQTLLESLADRLQQVYGKQFIKAMNVLISVYLPKINSISSGAAQGGVNRFQTFLEQKFRRQGTR